MNSTKYSTTPKTRRALEDRLRNVVPETQLQRRARRQLGYIAVASALMHNAKDEHGDPLFLIKGGVAIELLLGLKARATKDLDASARIPNNDIPQLLAAALAYGWDNFTFRLQNLNPIPGIDALRGDIKVSYQGDPWSTVQFEVSTGEGQIGQTIEWADNTFIKTETLGLTPNDQIPIITIAYLIAQKLHACTDFSDSQKTNTRYRDLIDLILVSRLITKSNHTTIREACREVFNLRNKHPWPPKIHVPNHWIEGYRVLAKELEFQPEEVHQAAAQVDLLITRINQTN